ncbi:MAG TPA: ZIP family metal transporter [Actinomycetota bacterium]|nr:ZIP family metal transporter [Actinomycetota bacterium]
MSTAQTVLLGAIAGATIFLGLPLGRLRNPAPRLKSFLNATSAGILLFLLFEIFHGAFEPVEHAVEELHEGQAAWGRILGFGGLFVGGWAVGMLSLLYLIKWQRSRRAAPSIGPGAMAMAEAEAAQAHSARTALGLGMSIAAGIGLHNFSEGLAIGQTAKAGNIDLALLLVVGFALHNATEGFGIIGPLAAGGVRASWGYLLLAGLIGGGPTFLGTAVGVSYQSEYVSVAFLALAGGAIVYVVAELLNMGRRLAAWDMTVWGILAGLFVGGATELVIKAAGG